MRQEPAQEFLRLHLEAPPKNSPVEGAKPPFCPFMQASVPIARDQGVIQIAGQARQSMEIQVNSVGLPCMRQNCLFWDRLDVRCAFTSLLDLMLCGGDEDEPSAGTEDGASPPAPVQDSPGG